MAGIERPHPTSTLDLTGPASAGASDPVDPATAPTRRGRAAGASVPTPATVHGRVASSRRVAPNLLEVTLSGFADHPSEGGDEFVYVMVSPGPGGIPAGYGMEQYLARAADDPVRGAYYTVRRSRPALGELDLWVVAHDHPGSVAAWMAGASAGDPVALWGPRRGFQPPDDVEHVLLVADETGFAAVAAVLEALPADRRATAVLECVDADHRPVLPAHPGLEPIWTHRGADAPGRTNRLLDTLRSTSIVTDAAFGAGESRQIGAVRRHVRRVLGVPAGRALMTGYWRRQAA